MLFKKELTATRDMNLYQALTAKLKNAGIPYNTVVNSPTNPGRYHGVPNIKTEAAYEYRIFVKRKLFKEAERIISQ